MDATTPAFLKLFKSEPGLRPSGLMRALRFES
jgi:hypothetical protein